MDAVAALLRTAMRIADARAAIVAYDDEPAPLAYQGCGLGAASDAVREREGAVVSCDAPGRALSLILPGATATPDRRPACEAVARELGCAVLSAESRTARLTRLAAIGSEKLRLSVTLKAIGDGVITVAPDGRIDFINAAAQRMLDLTFPAVYGAPLRSVVMLRDDRGQRCEIRLDPGETVRGEGELDHPDRQLHLGFVSSPIVAGSGAVLGFVIVLRDTTAQARLTKRLAYEASHDALTRLPNRRHFEEIVDAALDSARHRKTQHTVAFIDLDNFKTVNDTFGHQAGDRLLRELAQRMARNVRGNDVLARIGGDEFALLLHECSADNAVRVADKLRSSVEAASGDLIGPRAAVRASVGLAQLDAAAADVASVLAAADRACYAAKAAGRNAVMVAASIAAGSS